MSLSGNHFGNKKEKFTTQGSWGNRLMIEIFLSLHEEIVDFVNYVCPSPEEHWVREIIVSKVRNVISSLWRECKVSFFFLFLTV